MASLFVKTVSLILAVSLQFSSWFFGYSGKAADYPGNWYGDVNGNGIVDNGDAALVLKYLLNTGSLSYDQTLRADADKSGAVTFGDMFRIIKTVHNMYGLLAFGETETPDGDEGDNTQFSLGAYDLVVSPEGSDSWSGRLAAPNDGLTDGPLLTLERAKAILAAEKAELSGSVTVWLRGGTYDLDEALVFDESDASGVTYRNYPGETPALTASNEVGNWTQDTVNGVTVWKSYVGAAEMNALYRGNATLSRARYPKSGYFTVKAVSDDDTFDPTSWNNQCQIGFYDDTGVLKDFHNTNDVDVRILHLWKDELMSITGCDTSTGHVSLSKYTTMTVRVGDRYYFENVLEALSEPGEWYYDTADGMVYYVPYATDSINSTVLRYGTLETVLTMDGCEDISFTGITFRDTAWSIRSNSSCSMTKDGVTITGLASPQAASDVSSAVDIVNSSGIAFSRCKFTNIGMTAVKFRQNTQSCAVNHCNFYNIGASAVTIAGQNLPDEDPTVVHNIDVTDCSIYKYGRVFNYAVGILLMHANRCSLSNNEIHDGYYSGISAGWSWGYGYSVTHDLSLCNNIIYDIGQGVLSDMGGIYTLGLQRGTVLSGNIIHDVSCDEETGMGYGGWGLHLDEGTSYVTVEKNLIYHCSSQGLHVHYGMQNLVQNNIFVLNEDGQVVVDKKEDHHSMHFTHNIVVSRYQAIYNRVKTDEFTDDANLYWDYSRKANIFSSGMEKYYMSEVLIYPLMRYYGYYNNCVVKNPLFADVDNLDFTVCPNSPAIKMGFVPWDYSIAGIR